MKLKYLLPSILPYLNVMLSSRSLPSFAGFPSGIEINKSLDDQLKVHVHLFLKVHVQLFSCHVFLSGNRLNNFPPAFIF